MFDRPSLAIVQYQWALGDLENKPKFLTSGMLTYRGEKVFQVGLINRDKSSNGSLLFLIGINLHKIGLSMENPLVHSAGTTSKAEMQKEKMCSSIMVQFFTLKLSDGILSERVTYNFEIHLRPIEAELKFCIRDSSLENGLWEACCKGLYWPDIEIVVEGSDVVFKAHKAILAAASSVFASQFGQANGNKSLGSIRLNGVNSAIAEKFLKFIYTGAVEEVFTKTNNICCGLLKLAVKYGVATLENICRRTLEDVDMRDLAKVTMEIKSWTENIAAEVLRDEVSLLEKADIAFYEFFWYLEVCHSSHPTVSEVFSCDGRPLCFASLKISGGIAYLSLTALSGYTIDSVQCHIRGMKNELNLHKLNQNLFWTTFDSSGDPSYCYHFKLRISSMTKDYRFSLMDAGWSKNLLDSCSGLFTDVELFCGTEKFSAHRVVLALRSPVFQKIFGEKSSNEKEIIYIEDKEPAVVSSFLRFIYTGILLKQAPGEKYQLEELAQKYEVDSLINWLATMEVEFSAEDVLMFSF